MEWSAEGHAAFIDVLAQLLARWAAQTDQRQEAVVPLPPASLFFSVSAVSISVEAYVHRVARFFKCSAACLLMAYVYIERLAQDHGILVCTATAHRCVLPQANALQARTGGRAIWAVAAR